MLKLIKFFAFFIVIFLYVPCNISFAEPDLSSEIIYEQYYITKTKGMETGFVHVIQRKKLSDKNIPVIITEKHFEQRFKRLNDNIEIIQDQSFTEDESGKPVEFWFKSVSTGENIEITGKFDWLDDKIIVKSVINDIEDLKTIEFNRKNEKILFPFALDKLYSESEKKEKEIIEYSIIEPGLVLQILKVKAKKISEEKHIKYQLEINIFPNTDIFEWRDENSRIVKEATSIMDIEQIAVDKKEVFDIPAEFDVFSESFIKVDKTITNPGLVEQVIYKITAENMPVDNIFLFDETQKIIQIQDNTVFLKVKAEKHDGYSFPYPFDTRDYKKYLKSGPFIITDSKKIQEVADRLSSGETDSFKLAKKTEKWVYNNITNKNLAIDFANAVKILETKSGDCTEHSILLASLLRASGIPAKVTVGLLYTNSPENAFVYHMWVKAFVGKWVNLDPSFPYKNFTPLHLAMAESSLNDISEKTGLVLDIIDSFSKIDIEILNASKPIITALKGKPEIKINLNNQKFIVNDNLVNIDINKPRPVRSKVQEIKLPVSSETKENIKAAFYNFTKGNIEDALEDLKEFHKTIESDDDFLRMKLVLKLISMSYFNFASEVLEEIKDKDIWKVMINDIPKLYFPKNFIPDYLEKVQVADYYELNYENNPEFVIELTENKKNLKNYDYIYYLRAKAFKKTKDFEEAEKELNTAIKINPDNLTYKLELINILSGQNKIRKAQENLSYLNLQAKKCNIKYQYHHLIEGFIINPKTFTPIMKWLIEDDADRTFFKLKWG